MSLAKFGRPADSLFMPGKKGCGLPVPNKEHFSHCGRKHISNNKEDPRD